MIFDEQWPRLEGLFALSQARGLDVRPTLLRVLTDMFVEGADRSEGEIRRFAELATHLIDQVDEDTRIVIAGKLGPYRHTPRTVVDKLIASEPEAAGKVIEASPLLGRDDLWTLASDDGPMTAAAIARRRDLEPELASFLARKGFPLVAEALVLNPAATLDREATAAVAAALADSPDMLRRLAAKKAIEPAWLASIFLELDASIRISIVEAYAVEAAKRTAAPRETQIAPAPNLVAAIEAAALSRRPDEVAASLGQALEVDTGLAARLVADEVGDALALALLAIGMPTDQAARVLMFTIVEAGESVERLRALTALMDRVPRLAATRLVRALTASGRAAGQGHHETVFVEGSPARSKTPAKRREAAAKPQQRTGRKRD